MIEHLDAPGYHRVVGPESVDRRTAVTDHSGQVVLLGCGWIVMVEGVGERGHMVEPGGGEPVQVVGLGSVASQCLELCEEQARHRAVPGSAKVTSRLDQHDAFGGASQGGQERVVLVGGVFVASGQAGVGGGPVAVG